MSDIEDVVQLPINFHLKDDAGCDLIIAKAREIDDREHGEHMAEYTIEQAITVVFHDEPEFLFQNGVLWGWTVNLPDMWRDNEWVPAGIPEGHVIEEEPV